MGQAQDLSEAAIRHALGTKYLGRTLVYLDSTTSTMDVALKLAQTGAPEGTVVVADEQTAGRGRFQRAWVSPKGASLLLSVVFRPELPQLTRLNMVASLAVVRSVRRETGLAAGIKWPNDVQVRGRKLCGILIDSALKDDGVDYAVVGIGLNVNLDPARYPEIAETATSLSAETHRPVSRLALLKVLLEEMEGLYDSLRREEPVHLEWKRHLVTLGKNVTVTWPSGPERLVVAQGVAVDADDDGALVVRRADGTVVKVVAGEASLTG